MASVPEGQHGASEGKDSALMAEIKKNQSLLPEHTQFRNILTPLELMISSRPRERKPGGRMWTLQADGE